MTELKTTDAPPSALSPKTTSPGPQVQPPQKVRWPKRLKAQIATVNQAVQILAIVLAGAWAWYHFKVTEAPTHGQNFLTEPEIEWQDAPQASHCYAVFSARFDNLSRSRIPIERVRRRFWIVPQPTTADNVTFISMGEPQGAPVDSLSYTRGPFVQEYAPGAKVAYDLTWLVKRQPGIAVVRVDLFEKATDSVPAEWTYVWDDVCEGRMAPAGSVSDGQPSVRRATPD